MRWEYLQSEYEEHGDLHEPGDAIVEDTDAVAVDQVLVPDNESSDVNGEKAAAAEGGCDGIREQGNGYREDGIEAFGVKADSIDGFCAEVAESESGCETYDNLSGEEPCDLPAARRLVCDEVEEDNCEQHGHGVVAAGFEFDYFLKARPERQALGAKQGDDCGGIGGRNDGAHEKPVEGRELPDPRHKQAD